MSELMNEWMSVHCVLHYNLSNSAYISNCHVTWMNEWVNEWMSVQCVLHYNLSLIQLTFRIVMLHEWMNERMNEWVNVYSVCTTL